MAKVEIVGLERLKAALQGVNQDLVPPVLREIARNPALSAARTARVLMPIGDTGMTAKTLGTLKVKNSKQSFVEVGFRGRSLGHIYMSGDTIRRNKRGSVKGFPWLFRRTGEAIKISGKAELKANITKVIARSFKKRGYS